MYTNNQNVINVLNQKVVEVDKVDITVEDLDTILISGTLKDKGSLFTPIMTELEVQVKNDFSTFKNKEMNLARYIGTTGNIEVIDYGDFEIIKAEYDTINDATKLIGYNEMLRSQVPYDHEDIGASFPISAKDLLEKIAYFMGVDFQIIGVSSTRYNQMIPKDYWANDLSYTVRDVMTDVCELTTATLAIRNGKLTLFDPIDTGITINTGSGVLIKDKFGKTNIMNISYEPQHDNHYSPQNAVNKNSSEYIELEDREELMFENNPIFLDDPQHYADTLLPRVKDLEYTVGDFKAYHMGIFQVGDIVRVNGYKWLITEQIYKLTNVLVEFKSERPNAYQLQYVVETDQKRQGQSTSLTVDKLEGVINANITRLEEMTQDITDLNLDIDGIKGYVEGYKFDPININTSGEYGNYDNWTFYDVNDNLRNYPLLAHRKGMNQFTNFYIRKNPRSLAESDIVFFSERMAMNGIYRVFNQFDYGLKFQRVEGNQAFAIQIVEVDENYQETQIQTFMFTEQRLYEEVRNIKLHENTMYAGIRFVVTDVSLANPLAITETMFGIGAPKDYTQTANGVLQYAKGLFELQNDQAKLMIEDIQMINGRSIRNEAGLSILSDNVNLLAQRTTSVEGNIGDLEGVIQDYDEDIGDLLSFKQSAEIDLKPENISLAVRQSSEYQNDIGELVRKDNVLAQINLSEEGVVIDGDKVQINGDTVFASGYDPSSKATEQDITNKINELNLGDMAFKDKIGKSMLDNTIIEGGFIKTSLILVNDLYAIAAKIGGWDISSSAIYKGGKGIHSGSYATDPAIWVGEVYPWSDGNWKSKTPFYVDNNGKVFATNGEFSGKIKAITGQIGRFDIQSNNLVYTSDLFNYQYDNSDVSRLQSILRGLISANSMDIFLYDIDRNGTLNGGDLARVVSFVRGTTTNTAIKIRSVIEIGTNQGVIKTRIVSQTGINGATTELRADKMSSKLVNTSAFATDKMYLEGREVQIDSNGWLKAI